MFSRDMPDERAWLQIFKIGRPAKIIDSPLSDAIAKTWFSRCTLGLFVSRRAFITPIHTLELDIEKKREKNL